MQMTCDVDEEVKKLPYTYPGLILVEGDSSMQFFLVAEKAVLCESSEGFFGALLDLICAYFTYNIVYPKSLYPVLLFVQCYVMDIKDSQKIPSSLTRALTVLHK